MKKMIALISLIAATASFAAQITVDTRDIDSLVLTDGNEISIQDIQDGISSLRGVKTQDENLLINTGKLDKSVHSIKMSNGTTMVIRGGDMGGGGMG